jgi:predicted nucleotidyltransferase
MSQVTGLIRKEIEPLAKVAWLTGSYVHGSNNDKSDIDLVIVLPDSCDELKVEARLEDIHKDRKLDTTFFHESDIIKRAKHNDYLLGSLLGDETYLFGDMRFLIENKETIFSKKPDEDSVKFNFFEALHSYDMTLITFHNFRYFYRSAYQQTNPDVNEFKKVILKDSFDFELPENHKSYDLELARGYLLQTAKNCVYTLGYFYASQLMEKARRTITLRDLMKNNDLFNCAYNYQKNCRRNRKIDAKTVEDLITTIYGVLNETY